MLLSKIGVLKSFFFILYKQHETRHRFSDLVRHAAFPNGRAMERIFIGCGRQGRRRRRCRWGTRGQGLISWVAEASDSQGSVEVLPDLGNNPILDGPGMDPGDGTVSIPALDEDCWSERCDGLGHELEGSGQWGWGWAGEEAHHELVGGRSVEPPLEVGGKEFVHLVSVSSA